MPLHHHESPALFDAISKLDFQLASFPSLLPEGQISDEGEDKMIDGRSAIADWLANSQSTYSLTLSVKGSELRKGWRWPG